MESDGSPLEKKKHRSKKEHKSVKEKHRHRSTESLDSQSLSRSDGGKGKEPMIDQSSSPVVAAAAPIHGPVKHRVAVLNKRASEDMLVQRAAATPTQTRSTTPDVKDSRDSTPSKARSATFSGSRDNGGGSDTSPPQPAISLSIKTSSIVHTALLIQSETGPGLQGTPEELVDHLLDISETDDKWIRDFLCTFRYFLTPRELLLQLVTRYKTAPPVERYVANQIREMAAWKQRVGPLQARILGVLQKWALEHFYDFEADDVLFRSLLTFIDTQLGNEQALANKLRLAIQQQCSESILHALGPSVSLDVIAEAMEKHSSGITQDQNNVKRRVKQCMNGRAMVDWLSTHSHLRARADAVRTCAQMIAQGLLIAVEGGVFEDAPDALYQFRTKENDRQSGGDWPDPLFVPSAGPLLTFLDFKPLEVARQLTLISHEVFKMIHPMELKSLAWEGTGRDAPHVRLLMDITDRLTYWTASELLTTRGADQRRRVLSRCINLASHLRDLNNFTGLFAVMAALCMPPVARLHRTWGAISDKNKRLFALLAQLCDPVENCAAYRAKFRQLARPGLPLLDLVLSDLTFIDQSEPDFMDPPQCQIINFRKMRLMGNVLSSLQAFQRVSYRLKELPVVQEFLAKGVLITDEQTLLKLSLQCEPQQPNT